MKKLSKHWQAVPRWVKVGLWIGFSAGVTGILTYLLERPDLFQYYGVINFVLVTLNETDKKYRRGK